MITLIPAHHFGLLHEIFVLDAHLKNTLEQKYMKSITKNLINDLLIALRMEELGKLHIYPAVDQRAPGWSFIQPITTSHISGHYFEKPGRNPNIRMDFYSCCTVHWMRVIQVVDEHLNLADWRGTFIEREIELAKSRHTLEIAGFGDQITYEAALSAENALTLKTPMSAKEQQFVKHALRAKKLSTVS